MSPVILYGAPFSLWTGRARSYLIKSGIDYREQPHASPHFYAEVLPKAGGRRGIPTLEFPNGDVIRDGVAIVDHFEALNEEGYSPDTPRQLIVSWILDLMGAEGMLRPCMHYRWNFDQDNEDFLLFHFQTIFNEENSRQAAIDRMAAIRENVNPIWGVTPKVHDLIESYHEVTLEKLNAHFASYPYFLGGKPCRGDFGMIAPFYGHLGRDPAPLSLMQKNAVRLFRWTERMNRPEPDMGEFENREESYILNDEVPQTLIEVLRHFATDLVPETQAACLAINEWLAENKDLPPGTEVERGVAMCRFDVNGIEVETIAQPFRFYVLKRMQDAYASFPEDQRATVDIMLDACNMRELLNLKLDREIGRACNLEVWM
jgi:glutathione S-transferase